MRIKGAFIRVALIFAALCLTTGGAEAQAQAQAIAQVQAPGGARFSAQAIERGRYLATAGDCAACHSAPGGNGEMAGGYPIVSPLGVIYSTNITPSRDHGVGGYSEQAFGRALRQGVRADGARLYPAMPYTAYAGLTDADVHDLYAYFMSGVSPVEKDAPTTRLPFPFNIRASMLAWNALFLRSKPVQAVPERDAQWNRGRYLAETLGHCSTCHTPRGLLMQEKTGAALSGGPLGAWYAPNITSDKVSGIGGWSHQEIAQYLSTGRVAGKAQAAGGMAEAVTHSFSKMNRADIDAIASYIATVPPVREPGDKRPAYDWGKPTSAEAAIRGGAADLQGARLYSGLCAACHGRDGSGSPDGVIPSLHHNTTIGASRPDNLVAVILNGVDRTVGERHVLMPGFGEGSFVQSLSDEQVASLATYLRGTYGPGGEVTAKQVARAHALNTVSMLLVAARLGLVLAVLVLIGAVAWWLRRRKRSIS
jgi:mono/diheme cytochrome c family protein